MDKERILLDDKGNLFGVIKPKKPDSIYQYFINQSSIMPFKTDDEITQFMENNKLSYAPENLKREENIPCQNNES